jgi:pimeloyl-ACP methyl ester carboxylesterase
MALEENAMIDVGKGPPLVLVPGIQARWEWMRPAVKALSEHFRVLTFTLAGEPSSGQAFEPRLGFDNFTVQLDRVFEDAGLESAIVCGVSYGGLIALRYAALRPRRTDMLVLASAIAPGFRPDRRFEFYERAPRLLLPVFGVAAARRARQEIRAALPGWRERLRFSVGHGARVLMAPVSPRLMIRRIRLLSTVDFREDVRRVTAPTLVVTGDAGLDRTVPVEQTREYLRLLPCVEAATLDRTGHLGTVTRPAAFSRLVHDFVARTNTARRAGQPLRVTG